MTRERAEEECISISEAYEEGYERGKEDATKELPTSLYCDGFYDGFYDGYKKGGSDAIDECIKVIKNSIPNEESFTKVLLVKGLEQLKEQK